VKLRRFTVGLHAWARTKPASKSKARQGLPQKRADKTKESLRWNTLIQSVQKKITNSNRVIHIADREADDYTTFYHAKEQNIRFIIRVKQDRRIQKKVLDEKTVEKYTKIWESMKEAQITCNREVPISARKAGNRPPKARETHPDRKKRIVQLGMSAKTLEVNRSRNADLHLPKTLELNFVRVFELNPPPNEKPIEWLLVTTEPILTAEDLLKIIDAYRVRWVIEEYFKALKTGCAFEKRGLETLHALLNCLAIFAPIACNLYNLKMLGRTQPERKSETVVTPTQIKILAKMTKQTELELQTVGTVMRAIATVGGHLKHNGLPGWQVLHRGYEKLLQLEQGWLMATQPSPEVNLCMSRGDM
jgi:hypothetical protein